MKFQTHRSYKLTHKAVYDFKIATAQMFGNDEESLCCAGNLNVVVAIVTL